MRFRADLAVGDRERAETFCDLQRVESSGSLYLLATKIRRLDADWLSKRSNLQNQFYEYHRISTGFLT